MKKSKVLIIAFIAINIYIFNFMHHGRVDDDNLFFLSTGLFVDSDEVDRLQNEIAFLLPPNADSEFIWHYKIRQISYETYFVPRLVYSLAHYILSNILPYETNINLYIALLLQISFFLSFLLCIFLFCIILILINDTNIDDKIFNTIITISLLYLITSMMCIQEGNWFGMDVSSFPKLLKNIILLIFRPMDTLFIFGYTPRNNMVFFIFLLFVLRWESDKWYTYYLLPLAILFHASMAMLFLVFIIVSDLIFSVKRFVRFHYLFPIMLSILFFIINGGDFLNMVNSIVLTPIVFLGFALVIILIYFWHKNEISSALLNLFKIKHKYIFYDMFSLVVGLIISFIFFNYFYLDHSNFSNVYFVKGLHGRFLGSISVVIIYSLFSTNNKYFGESLNHFFLGAFLTTIFFNMFNVLYFYLANGSFFCSWYPGRIVGVIFVAIMFGIFTVFSKYFKEKLKPFYINIFQFILFAYMIFLSGNVYTKKYAYDAEKWQSYPSTEAFDNIQTGKIPVIRASSHEIFLYYALLRSMIQNNDYYKILK